MSGESKRVRGVALDDREGWIYHCFYSTIYTAVATNGGYIIAGSFSGISIYKTVSGNRMTIVSNGNIKFSEAHGWGLP